MEPRPRSPPFLLSPLLLVALPRKSSLFLVNFFFFKSAISDAHMFLGTITGNTVVKVGSNTSVLGAKGSGK